MLTPLRNYIENIQDCWFMTIPAAALTFMLEYTGAHAEAFITWCILSAADLIFGISVAVIHGTFCTKKLYHWIGKIFVQLLTVFIFAAVLRTLAIATADAVSLIFANWLLLFYCLIDASSLMEKFLQLGLMPKPALIILRFLRRRTSNAFAAMAGDPHLAREMEKALEDGSDMREKAEATPSDGLTPDEKQILEPK